MFEKCHSKYIKHLLIRYQFQSVTVYVELLGRNYKSWLRRKLKAPVTLGLRPCYDLYTTTKWDESGINRWQIAIDVRSRGLSYEQIWSQQGRWPCSKLRTRDYTSQEVTNRSYMIVRPVVRGRTINRAWSCADRSGDLLDDHAIGRATCGTDSRLVVWSITISDGIFVMMNV